MCTETKWNKCCLRSLSFICVSVYTCARCLLHLRCVAFDFPYWPSYFVLAIAIFVNASLMQVPNLVRRGMRSVDCLLLEYSGNTWYVSFDAYMSFSFGTFLWGFGTLANVLALGRMRFARGLQWSQCLCVCMRCSRRGVVGLTQSFVVCCAESRPHMLWVCQVCTGHRCSQLLGNFVVVGVMKFHPFVVCLAVLHMCSRGETFWRFVLLALLQWSRYNCTDVVCSPRWPWVCLYTWFVFAFAACCCCCCCRHNCR